MDFVHISHVGWHPNTGFEVDSADEQFKFLLHKVEKCMITLFN